MASTPPGARAVDVDEVRGFLEGGLAAGAGEPDRGMVGLAKRVLPHAYRDRARIAATRAVRRRSRRRAGQLTRAGGVRLNLGSGFAPVEGFVNVDLVGAPVDLAWDLALGIPFPDQSVEGVYSAHVLEHVPLDGAIRLLREARRVLRPGGPVRIVVPDAGMLLGSYAGLNDATWAHEFPTRMLAVNDLFYTHGHVSMWDGELLTAALRAAGFVDVGVRGYEDTALRPCPDDESRSGGSLYVEGHRA